MIINPAANVCSRSQCCSLYLNFMVLAFCEGAKLDFKLIRGREKCCSVLDLQFYEMFGVWHKLSVGWNTETVIIITAYAIPYDCDLMSLNL